VVSPPKAECTCVSQGKGKPVRNYRTVH
jgi:hypothetical protein